MKKNVLRMMMAACAMVLAACEKPDIGAGMDGNVTLKFTPTTADVPKTRATTIGDYFTKLNVQLFDETGEKVFDKVKTQTMEDEGFGTLNFSLDAGTYTVVAVGHSSVKSATIKSPQLVQFTASDGQKLTDTFCYSGQVAIDADGGMHELKMNRVCAMVRFRLTDEEIPEAMERMKFDYTGGSANFNPSTMEGCTKSTQSETRLPAAEYQVFTFPYMSSEGKLKVTLTALDGTGNVLKQKTLTDVPVTRNRITTYTGSMFGEGEGSITQSGFGITVNGDWDGDDQYTF